jgi:crotonobetainyl-CoA hydratase
MSEVVHVARRPPVVEIVMDRPPVNAVDQSLADGLYRAFRAFQDDDELRVALLTGAGTRCFSAGWDLKAAAAALDAGTDTAGLAMTPGGFAGITEFWDLDKPVVAALNGPAIGGGFEIALSCDVLLAADHVYFALPEMQRGFLPDGGAVQSLPRKVPYNVAMEMLLTGRRVPAAEARQWGLVHEVLPAERLFDAARALADRIAEGAPLALRALKAVMRASDGLTLRESFALTKPGKSGLPIYEQMMTSEDFAEGPRAFTEKRQPVWKGR